MALKNCVDTSRFQIWKYPYVLKRKIKANSQTQSEYQYGALIKIQDEDGHFGYSDLCPWPSLGDLTLDEELNLQGPLFVRAIQLAFDDLNARIHKEYLVNKNPIRNNVLVSHYRNWFEQNKIFDGMVLKIKGDACVIELAHILNQVFKGQFNLKVSLRLDFNFCLTANSFQVFLDHLDSGVLSLIEYVEDPFPFDYEIWMAFNKKVKLALDWNTDENNWDFKIFKPSRETIENHELNKNCIFTSAMDHPVGIVHGLRWAQKYPDNVHGFGTLDSYEPTDFNYFFENQNDLLRYHTDGFGIGFTQILSRLNWIPIFQINSLVKNYLLCSHRLSNDETLELFKIRNQLCKQFDLEDCFLIASSGSTQKENESVKLIVLKRQALIESAKRVNQTFDVIISSVWGCVLPLYHVGGLGVLIRAQIAQCRFIHIDWADFTTDWIQNNNVTHLSLVPTQLFEIVQKKLKAPSCLKYVFIGGASLQDDLASDAILLGWPIVQTFGMTETGSMIAVKKDFHSSYFQLLNDVKIKQLDKKLAIQSKSNALMSAKFNRLNQEIVIDHFQNWLVTQDEVKIVDNSFQFLQRDSDYVKINGEGVSLFELRQKLDHILNLRHISNLEFTICDFPHDRNGSVLRFVISEELGINNNLLNEIISEFNSKVRPYEKISSWIMIDKIPKTDLNKIKYNEIKKQGSLNVKKI